MNMSNLLIANLCVYLKFTTARPLQFNRFIPFTNAPLRSFCVVYNPYYLLTCSRSACSSTKPIK